MQLPNLRRWRELRGLTQRELSDLAGVSPRAIAGYEAGAEARPGSARKLATTLDVDIMDLVGVESGKAPAPPSQERLFNGISEQQRRALDRIENFCDQLENAITAGKLDEPHATIYRGRVVDLGAMIPALYEVESIRPELRPLAIRFLDLARQLDPDADNVIHLSDWLERRAS